MATATRHDGHGKSGFSELVKASVEDVQELVKIETALAKQEVRQELSQLKGAAIAFAAAAVSAQLALAMLLVALLYAVGGGAPAALACAAVLLVLALVAGATGYRRIPRSPLPERTIEDVEEQAKRLKERIA